MKNLKAIFNPSPTKITNTALKKPPNILDMREFTLLSQIAKRMSKIAME